MPRQRECVHIFDEVRQIDIAWLRDEALLSPDRYVKGYRLEWKGGSSVEVDVDTCMGFLRITEGYGVDRRTSIVRLERRPSNLGKGSVWYFICPSSGKLCRKLYGINGSFLSRHVYPRGMYRSQTEPKSDRRLRRYITLNGTLNRPKVVWDSDNRINFRAFYMGKPTKRYLDYLNRTRKLKLLLASPILAPMRIKMPDFIDLGILRQS